MFRSDTTTAANDRDTPRRAARAAKAVPRSPPLSPQQHNDDNSPPRSPRRRRTHGPQPLCGGAAAGSREPPRAATPAPPSARRWTRPCCHPCGHYKYYLLWRGSFVRGSFVRREADEGPHRSPRPGRLLDRDVVVPASTTCRALPPRWQQRDERGAGRRVVRGRTGRYPSQTMQFPSTAVVFASRLLLRRRVSL